MDGAEGAVGDAGAACVQWYPRQQQVKLQSTYRKGKSLAFTEGVENEWKKTDLAFRQRGIGAVRVLLMVGRGTGRLWDGSKQKRAEQMSGEMRVTTCGEHEAVGGYG
ncbi:hypothetical protein B0H13DRAFT_1863855 [Mycena leptocephala]|nr:hypothetical protein B0H13DRAFT_1863855 [Mycena leptocephala]